RRSSIRLAASASSAAFASASADCLGLASPESQAVTRSRASSDGASVRIGKPYRSLAHRRRDRPSGARSVRTMRQEPPLVDRSRRSECSTLLRSGPMMVGRPSSPPPPRRGVLDRARSRWSGVPSAKGPGLQRSALSVALLFAFGCRDGDDGETGDDGPMVLATTGNANGSSTGDDAYVPSEEATDQCGLAPTIGAGRHEGTLRGKASELDGACGLGGPDAFLRLDVPRRSDVRLQAYGVGLVPRVGALPHTCATDWTSRTLACTQGVGTW